MAAAAGIRAGQAYVELGVNDAGMQRGLAAAQAKLKAFADGMQSVGKGLVGVSLALAAPLALSTNTYAGFEKSMAKVDALTRGQASNSEEAATNFRKLTEEAKRLGEQTEYSASQAAEMMYQFAMRGYQVKEILAATGPALQMATAGNMELAEAAGIAGDIMGGMKIPATELGRVTDIMAKAFSTSATDLRQLGEAFKYVGPTASSMGFSVTEVTAALQVLADAGQKGEMAGTTLRGMLETLKDPSKEARDELNRLGVVLDDGQGRFRDLASIIGDMEKGLGRLSQVDAASAISRIFTNRQTTGTTILVTPDQTGLGAADRIRKKDKALQSAEGTGAAIQARHLDTLWGAWKLIESAIEGVAITIGETLAPTIREWASATIHGIGLLHELIKANKDWIPTIAKTAVVIGGIGAAMFAVGATVSVVGFAVSGLATAFGAVASLIGAVFSPVVLGVAAAVGLVVAVVSEMGVTWESMIPALKAFGGAALAAVTVAVGAVMVGIEVVKKIGSVIGQVLKQIGKAFPDLVNSIGSTLSSIGRRFAGFFDDLSATFSKSWGGIVDAIKAGDLTLAAEVAMAGFRVAWKQGELFLMTSWRDTLGFFHDKWVDGWRNISLSINGIWYGIEKALFEGFAAVYRAWGWLMDSMKRQMAGAGAAWTTMAAGLKAGVTFDLDFQKKIEAAATKAQSDLKDELEAIKNAREAEINKELTGRQDIANRKGLAEGQINSAAGERKQAFRKETENQLRQPANELAEAMRELEEATQKARIALVASNSGIYAGGLAGLKAMEGLKDITPESIVARANQATGGPGAGSGASGTFDSSVARFLGGTNNAEMQLAELRRQLETQRQSKELLDRVIKILDDIRREGGAFFQ